MESFRLEDFTPEVCTKRISPKVCKHATKRATRQPVMPVHRARCEHAC